MKRKVQAKAAPWFRNSSSSYPFHLTRSTYDPSTLGVPDPPLLVHESGLCGPGTQTSVQNDNMTIKPNGFIWFPTAPK